EVHVEVKGCGDGARDLRHFHGVRQARAKVVRIAAREDLRLVLQTAEGARVNDTVAVALERITVRMWRLRIAAPAGILHANRVAGEHKLSLAAAHNCRQRSPRKELLLVGGSRV